MHQVTTDHAFRQTWLVSLVNHSAVAWEIGLATLKEFAQRHYLLDASPLGVPGADQGIVRRRRRTSAARIASRIGCKLDLPHAVATVAAVLLEDSDASSGKS
jgi:hypothetical protein